MPLFYKQIICYIYPQLANFVMPLVMIKLTTVSVKTTLRLSNIGDERQLSQESLSKKLTTN